MGINGNEVIINPTGEGQYEIQIPPFIYMGQNNFKSEVAAEESGILSWTNSEIDEADMINDVLGKDKQQELLTKYDAQLKESTEQFFTQLIKAIEPDANITFTYQPSEG
jgi:hypothetical protein